MNNDRGASDNLAINRLLSDSEVREALERMYSRHVGPVLLAASVDFGLSGSDLDHIRAEGRHLATFKSLIGVTRYERLVEPIRERWAAEFRDAYKRSRERHELEDEINEFLSERRASLSPDEAAAPSESEISEIERVLNTE